MITPFDGEEIAVYVVITAPVATKDMGDIYYARAVDAADLHLPRPSFAPSKELSECRQRNFDRLTYNFVYIKYGRKDFCINLFTNP